MFEVVGAMSPGSMLGREGIEIIGVVDVGVTVVGAGVIEIMGVVDPVSILDTEGIERESALSFSVDVRLQ